jgi:hypothetical protein
VEVTHQTGERDLSMVREAYAAAGLAARVEPFLYEMDREMRAADVIVCRAGATRSDTSVPGDAGSPNGRTKIGIRRPASGIRARGCSTCRWRFVTTATICRSFLPPSNGLT